MAIIDPKKDYAKQTESRMIIRFQDCDPLRHLNNAKYFDYFFNAREDQLPKLYGVEMNDLIRTYEAYWVVYNHHIAYLKSANLAEWVRVFSRLIHFNDDTLVVEYFMTDDQKSHLKTLMWTTFKYVGMQNSGTTSHSTDVREYLMAMKYEGVDYHPAHFEERVKTVKEQVKQGFDIV